MPDKAQSNIGQSSTGTSNDKAKEAISNVARQAGDNVAATLNTQKDKAAEGLGSVARALRQTGDHLRSENQTAAVPEYISSAADQVDRLSEYLRSANTRDMVNGLEQFARQQPALFVGGAFMLGLITARFLKSSGDSDRGRSSEESTLRGGRSGTQVHGRHFPNLERQPSGTDNASGATRTSARSRGTH